ncbi:MAG: glycosyltransferase family 2 protein [Syntrophales bacterium]
MPGTAGTIDIERMVSVVIVNWNGRAFLPECLEALRRQVYRAFSVILVDNGSDDGSAAFVSAQYPEVRVLALPENKGFAAANNVALRMVETEFVALLNNDAVPDPVWLQSLVEALEDCPQAGLAASKMLLYDRRAMIDRAGDGYTRAGAALLRGRGLPAERHQVREWVFGACAAAALYRMVMLRDIGFFDEDFFLLYEDVDLSFRAQLKGYRCVYVPEALVYHRGSSSIGHDSPVSVYYGHRNLEWVYMQNMPFRLLLRTIVPHILYDIAACSYFVACGRGKDFFRAKRDALRGLKRAMKKRRRIQNGKVADDGYLWGLFGRPNLRERLAGRSKQR